MKVGDKVIYKTPMQVDVVAEVVGVIENEENPESPYLDLKVFDPTFKQTFTVLDIEEGIGIFDGSPHCYTRMEATSGQ